MKAPVISVCVSMYNVEQYVGECIDSILAQTFTDFELLIVDDGSTDASCEVVRSYSDPRIRLITSHHDYVDTLNRLLDESRGMYISRMDADDIMPSDRLACQYEYMQAHPEVDVLGGGMQYYRDGKIEGDCFPRYDGCLTIYQMLEGCCIIHATILARRSIYTKYNLRYEKEYVYAEDYRMWMQMLKAGVRMRNLNKLMLWYRQTDTQVSVRHSEEQQYHTEEIRNDVHRWLMEQEREAFCKPADIRGSENRLTVVIPFLNEGEEVARTVKSIRNTAGNRVDVIVINDVSDDGYPYEQELEGLNVNYVCNGFRLGAAQSKERGVQLCRTPYFLLLDAHMRFYDNCWVDRIVEALDTDANRLLCCQTKTLVKKDGIVGEKEGTTTYGAYLLFEQDNYLPGIAWNCTPSEHTLRTRRIPAVLGAGYASSKNYWNRIYGLQGLIHYGCEEAYISMKAWMEGGGCHFLPEVTIGHIYRERFPYTVSSSLTVYNNLFISEMLFPASLRCYARAKAWQKNLRIYQEVMRILEVRKSINQNLKAHVQKLSRNDFNYLLSINGVMIETEELRVRDEAHRLPEIMAWCREASKKVNRCGLMDGLAGYVILFCRYAAWSGEEEYDDYAGELFSRILDGLEDEYPITFRSGICGIGWTIIYLLSHGLLEEDMEDELKIIDRKVMERNLSYVSDLSIMTGIGGVLAYVVVRLGHCSRTHKNIGAFSLEYLRDIQKISLSLLRKDLDIRVRSLAMQMAMWGKEEWNILSPERKEVWDVLPLLPQNSRFWKPGMEDTAGYALCLIEKLVNLDKINII